MKRIITLTFSLLLATLAFSQSNYQDVVYLKNGSIIRGIIIERIPNESIKIETANRNVFVYKMNEIKKLTREPIKRNYGNSYNSQSNSIPGYQGIVELGYQIGVGDLGMDRLNLNIINGYRLNPYFSLGLGTGLRYYFDAQAALIPVFADFRANFSAKTVSPYLSMGIGYTFDATNDFTGTGFLLNPTAGVSFSVSEKSKMNVGIGYEMQKMEFFYFNLNNDYYQPYSSVKSSGAVGIKVGLSF